MPNKLIKLMNRAELLKAACQNRLNKIELKDKLLQDRKNKVLESIMTLNTLFENKRLDGNIVKRKDIFENFRKISVIRENISFMELELIKITEELSLLCQSRCEERAKIKALCRKEKKYEYLLNKIHEAKIALDFHYDEVEQEESYNGKNE